VRISSACGGSECGRDSRKNSEINSSKQQQQQQQQQNENYRWPTTPYILRDGKLHVAASLQHIGGIASQQQHVSTSALQLTYHCQRSFGRGNKSAPLLGPATSLALL
jgi:hypothetical protein